MGTMDQAKTKWESIGISNDFLFGKVMQNPELCKELLQRILPEWEIERIEYPQLQKTIKEDADARSVRLDVYLKDDKNTVYDIEMQAVITRELPKRSRYYQSMIDLQLLDKGQSYQELDNSFVIFICLTDMFGKGRHIYTFKNLCQEDKSLSLDDGTTKIFLNAQGTMDDTSKKLKSFLDYVAGKEVSDDEFINKLDEEVKKAKKNREWRSEFMTLYMRDLENQRVGEERGLEQGLKQGISATISILKELNVSDDIILQKLQEKYKLTQEEAEKYLSVLC